LASDAGLEAGDNTRSDVDTMKLVLFALLSVPIVWASWKTLFNFRHHGLYRFLGWECILFMLLINSEYWFVNPFTARQIVSWVLLLASLGLVIAGILLIRKMGQVNAERTDDSLYKFEKTTRLIEAGIYKYIRHPLYGSLILLSWGVYFKNMSLLPLAMATLSTIFLYITARVEEKEDMEYFGENYSAYMKRTKMFIPFIL
jgi:protein-S-isoprenylcysteine O-methyltransferase Ste14